MNAKQYLTLGLGLVAGFGIGGGWTGGQPPARRRCSGPGHR